MFRGHMVILWGWLFLMSEVPLNAQGGFEYKNPHPPLQGYLAHKTPPHP